MAFFFLNSLLSLKDSSLVFCNFRPENIYKVSGKYVIINPEYTHKKSTRNEMTDFVLEIIEKDWEYWAPEILDPYSKENLDYTLDMFAIGCILYQIRKNGLYPFESKLTTQSCFFPKIEDQTAIS